MFSVLLIASYTLLEPGSILGPEVSGEFLIWWTETFSVCAPFLGRWSLLAPGIFPKFWSIPSLRNPSAPTITGTVSVLIPHILVDSASRSLYFEGFSMTLRRSVSVGWYRYILQQIFVFWEHFNDFTSRCFGRVVPIHLAALVGMVLDHYIRVVR